MEVSPRTVLRDMDFLRDSLAMPILYDPIRYTFYLARAVPVDFGWLIALAGASERKGGA